MDVDEPHSGSQDSGWSRLADLAEGLAEAVALPRPDWCAMARDAAELARGARARCASADV